MANIFNWEAFNRIPVIGIMRNFPEEKMQNTLSEYYKAGLTTIEITMNSKNVKECIATSIAKWGDKLNIGAGTVCDLEDLDIALSAGAQYIVTPIINEEVIKACVKKQIPIFPGAFSPSEIYKAWSLGASMVKVFPAARVGAGFFKDLLQPLNKVKLVATGGVTLENFTDFLSAGAQGVGVGSNLFPKELIEEGRWDDLGAFFRDFVRQYEEFSKKR